MQVADLTIARKHLRSFIERQGDAHERPSHETAALMKLKEAATLIEETRLELATASITSISICNLRRGAAHSGNLANVRFGSFCDIRAPASLDMSASDVTMGH